MIFKKPDPNDPEIIRIKAKVTKLSQEPQFVNVRHIEQPTQEPQFVNVGTRDDEGKSS